MEKSGILERKAIIKNADMTEDMQQDAIECATAVRCNILLPNVLHKRLHTSCVVRPIMTIFCRLGSGHRWSLKRIPVQMHPQQL